MFTCESEATGRDREDQPDYKVRMSAAFCFSNQVQLLEFYHNSSWLEHGGSPEHAVRTAFVYQINKYLKDKGMYKKGESSVSFQDIQDCLVYVSSSFSTRTSYENQTKKAITNKFISQAMTDFLKHYLEVYFLEKPDEAQKICQQVLVNKQSREHAEKTRQSIKKTLSTQIDLANGCRNSWTAAPRTPPAGNSISWRATRPWARSRPAGTASSRPSCPSGAKF